MVEIISLLLCLHIQRLLDVFIKHCSREQTMAHSTEYGVAYVHTYRGDAL